MRLSITPDAVVVEAPAKLNMFLEILGKRADGYHEIATLMVAIDLVDTLTCRSDDAGGIELTCTKDDVPTGDANLVVRAAKLLQQETGCRKGCRLHLVKRIPMAAGLGGGSSDAAAALAGLNELWKLGLSRERLAALGGQLGSDVPFFFSAPAAWCTGRGEVVEAVPVARALDFVLCCPQFGMSTAEVYRRVRVPAEAASGEAIRAALAAGATQEIGLRLHNRLQPAAEALDPRLRTWDQMLAAARPVGHLMSGSGSSLFALCQSREQAEQLAEQIRRQAPGEQVLVVRSLD